MGGTDDVGLTSPDWQDEVVVEKNVVVLIFEDGKRGCFMDVY